MTSRNRPFLLTGKIAPRVISSAMVVIVLTCLLSGCAYPTFQTRSRTPVSCRNASIQDLLGATDLKALFNDIAVDLCTGSCRAGSPESGESRRADDLCNGEEGASVLVTDFVDINSFMPKQAGLLMGELMRGSLTSRCRYRLVQAEFATYFKLTENGLVSLTRNAGEIRNDEFRQSEAIVGTYNQLSANKLLIFVKMINTGTGRVSRMVTKELEFTCSDNVITDYRLK